MRESELPHPLSGSRAHVESQDKGVVRESGQRCAGHGRLRGSETRLRCSNRTLPDQRDVRSEIARKRSFRGFHGPWSLLMSASPGA